MKIFAKGIVTVVCIMLIWTVNLWAEQLRGIVGKSETWGVGWIDLESFTDFKKGDQIRIRIGGTAKKVLVRFLEKGDSPDSPVGIEGDSFQVPAYRVLTITLKTNYTKVKQISIHGGPNPWGMFPLGEDNGPATVISIERITGKTSGNGSRWEE